MGEPMAKNGENGEFPNLFTWFPIKQIPHFCEKLVNKNAPDAY